jgi:hypothetical protein
VAFYVDDRVLPHTAFRGQDARRDVLRDRSWRSRGPDVRRGRRPSGPC